VQKTEETDIEVYDEQGDWEHIDKVNHLGDGILDIQGTDDCSGKEGPTSELFDWHIQFGHMPFTRLQSMAHSGIIPT
jgi:hypothetical protein